MTLANDDQLWKQLTLLAKIPDKIMDEARERAASLCAIKAIQYVGRGSCQHLLQTCKKKKKVQAVLITPVTLRA